MSNNGIADRTVNQGIAAYVDYLRELRLNELFKTLDRIMKAEKDELADIALRERTAYRVLNSAENKIDDLININRGGDTGLHGFIAERAEEGVKNAERAYNGIRKCVTVIDNNKAADLHIGKHDVQMKFYSNLNNELEAATRYREMNMMYAKDHYDIYRSIMEGEKNIEFNGNMLSEKKINAIRQLIEDESEARGEPYTKWMESSNLEYDEVQKGRIHDTLSRERQNIGEKAKEDSGDVKSRSDTGKRTAYQEAKPSLGEASKAAGAAAAVQGGINLAMYVYEQHKDGKEIWEFDADNWKAAGIQTGKGVVKGGISGYSIYYLTNVCQLAAPSAGAITSGTFGLVSAVLNYRAGELDDDGFVDAVIFNSIDSTGAAVGAAIGQAIIPVPVVGAVVGTIAMSTVLSIGKDILNEQEQALIETYQSSMNKYIFELEQEYREQYTIMIKKYESLGAIQEHAFNLENNIRIIFASTVELAEAVGVDDSKILHDLSETDAFFM